VSATATSTSLTDRDIRQRELVPPERLATTACHVVGVGAVGRQLALQLAAVGVPALFLYDHDTVGVENLAAQGFRELDLGREKVWAVAEVCGQVNSQIKVLPTAKQFTRSHLLVTQQDFPELTHVLMLCVDSISTRRKIWDVAGNKTPLVIDARMAAETIFVFTTDTSDPRARAFYEGKFFAEGEAFQARCTGRSTIYTANIAAGLMVGQLAHWLRGLPVEPEVNLNLLSMELGVGTLPAARK
jgi:hypothetical protein